MSQDQLNRAIGLVQAGKKEDAREILLELVELEPYHVSVWMWLAETMPDDEQRIEVLKACLKFNPDSMMAKRGLQRFLESKRLKSRSSIENAPTVPLPMPSSSGTPGSMPGQPVPKQDVPRGVETAQLRQRVTASPKPPTDAQPAENIPAFRDCLLDNKKLPKVEPWSEIADKLKPTTSEVGKRPSISQKEGEPPNRFRGVRLPAGKKKATPTRGKPGLSRWVVLGIFGLVVVVAAAGVGFLLRKPIRQELGLGGTATPIQVNVNPPISETLPITITQIIVQSPTSTPNLFDLPTQITTASLEFYFPNPVIMPGMEKPLEKIAELSAPPALSLAFSPENRLLAGGMQDGTIFIWDLASRNVIQVLQGHTMAVNAVAFSPDARYILSGSEDGTAQTWNIETLQLLPMNNHSKAVTSVTFSPNGITCAIASLDGTITLWNIGASEPAGTLMAESGVTSLGFSPDGQWLVYGTISGEITLWNALTGGLVHTSQVHSEAVNSLQFSPDGKLFASGSADKSVKLWDAATGKVLFTVGSHTDSVKSVSFSPDGRLLASAELGHTLKIWDIANRKEVASLQHAQRMPGVAFSPDGRILASTLLPLESEAEAGGVALWGVVASQDITKSPARLDLDALKAGIWSTSGSMLLARSSQKMVAIASDQFLIIGGLVPESQASETQALAQQAELFSILTGSSSFTNPMNATLGPPSSTTATLLWDGRVLVIGDNTPDGTRKAGAEIYAPATNTWSLTDPLFQHGNLHTATLISDGRVLVVGGCTEEDVSGYVELFEPLTNSWVEAGLLPEPRCGHISTLLPNGHVLIAGGYGPGGVFYSSALTYNPNINQWQTVGEMATARAEAAAVLLTNGRVLVVGGLAQTSGSTITVKSVEAYNPDTGVWDSIEPMGQSRYAHTTTRLSSGLVMVVGGIQITLESTELYLADVEVYDPVSGLWTVIPPLQIPRAFHAARFLPDGRLLVLGGMDNQAVPKADGELFSPK